MAKGSLSFSFLFCVFFFFSFLFLPAFPASFEENAYPRAIKQGMPTLERPTLELPWSEMPLIFMRSAYPEATLKLPWSYPGAAHPYAYTKRLPCSSLPWSEIAYPGPTLDLPCSRNARPAAAPG
jgi:hypothetical protein